MAGPSHSQLARDRTAGLLLIAATAVALMAANSPLAHGYHALLEARIGAMSLHALIADGLMAVFFLLVGLEVKREWYEGQLASPAARRLPIVAAIAGMAVPALVYLAVVGFHPELVRGWAIPAATDIAFAIGVLALLGPRAPPSLKLLLVSIAIIDDIGAVAIIAVAYTAKLNLLALGVAALITGAMTAMAWLGVRKLWPFLVGFAALWLAMHESGVHATIAGVVAALTIPLGRGEAHSPLKSLEHAVHPWVMLGVVPLFGLASAGVALGGGALLTPLPRAILLGLFIGKQAGVFGAIWLAVRMGFAPKPSGTSWPQIYGTALLCGIGFTMSLFIGALAFPGDPVLADEAKVGILAGSIASAIAGFLILRFDAPVKRSADDNDEVGELFAADFDQ
ncbi:MAG TPA: Na+/H+ antiporter NhaA [Sphingomicrobium sp.]|nr:Na+/H+ antiporter NhaA [Sphingomicrobium sp.]